MTSIRLATSAALVLLATSARAELVTRTVEFKQGDTVLQGFLAYETGGAARKPGVLVVHDWMGVSDDTRRRVEQLANMGYVALAADIYGKGVRPTNQQEALAQALKYLGDDRSLARARVLAAFHELAKQPNVDPSRIAAIGFCFGGSVALELARSGADLRGVVAFHAGLGTPNPADAKTFKAKVLVLTGADDPSVPDAQIKAFEDEMRAAGVDYTIVKYSGAVHAFTVRSAGSDKSKGAAYDARAERRAFQAMEDFFAEIFADGAAPAKR